MERHCQNAREIAAYLEHHPKIARVHYPLLASHPQHPLALRQMPCGGGMVAFEMKGGYEAGVALMEHVRISTLVVSLGNVDSLISHPASMTHSNLTPEVRRAMGIADGLVRYSIGIENVEDLIADIGQALEFA